MSVTLELPQADLGACQPTAEVHEVPSGEVIKGDHQELAVVAFEQGFIWSKMDSINKLVKNSKQGVQKGATWAANDGVVLAKSAGEKTKVGLTKGVAWAKSDGVGLAKKGATNTSTGLVAAANWTAAAGKKGMSKISEKLKK